MAKTLQKIKIDGKEILVEVSDIVPPVSHSVSKAGGTKFADTSALSGDAINVLASVDMRETIQTMMVPLHAAMKALAPDEATVELNLGFAVKGNLFVASGEGSASIKVSAKWKFDAKPA